jgi:hypothetical protein
MSTDPRDLFINLNPLGLDERELEKDSTGFANMRTHNDYLVFLAGYKVGTVDGEKHECQRHRPMNTEGCKPEISIMLSGMPCAGAAVPRSLDKAEGCKPDLITPPLDYNELLAEAAACYLLREAPVTYSGKVFTISMKDGEQAFEIVVTTQRIGAETAHELREKAESERDHAIAESERLQSLLGARNALLDHWLQLANVCDDRNYDLMQETRNELDEAISKDGTWTFAARDVLIERRRQITSERRTMGLDDATAHGQLSRAAACYALSGACPPSDGTAALLVSLAWPWDESWWKPTTQRRDLVKAGALILAELERLDRIEGRV